VILASKAKDETIKKKEDTHRMAEATALLRSITGGNA